MGPGRTFQVALDHVPADAGLAQRLLSHLKPLQRNGTIKGLWHPGAVLPGDAATPAARDAVLDADLTLILLSPDYLDSDDPYERLRLAHAAQQKGRLQLVPVQARPCTLDNEAFPGLQLVPAGRPVSAYPNPDDACHEVAVCVRRELDLLARQPPGRRRTLRDVATEAFRLDRTGQWKEVKAHSAGSSHHLFVLYGARGQAVALFAERLCRLLEHDQGAPHLVVPVPIRNRVTTAADIENKLRGVLARELDAPATDTGALLQRLAKRARLFLVLGGVQDERWPLRERQALADFLAGQLPALLPRDGHPVQALLMFEYKRPETSLLPWIDSWAGALAAPLRYCRLPKAELPSWHEVEEVLEGKGLDPETVAALRRFYDELTSSEAPSFERLADELDQYLK